MTDFRQIRYFSSDGLSLYGRDYFVESAPLTLLCMPGLTRNSADFEPMCEHLYPDYRLLTVDLRGRGNSDWDSNPANYQPGVYVKDVLTMIDALGLTNLVLVGTSLGGLLAMILNALRPGAFRGLILNDVGPVVDPRGLARIQAYVGRDSPVSNWAEAIEQTRQINQVALPNYRQPDWEKMARRIYRENDRGIPELLYDPAIAQQQTVDDGVPDNLWAIFEQSLKTPVLVIRGVSSDILSAATVAEMRRRKPDLHSAEVPNVGHAPNLDEAVAVSAINAFLNILRKEVKPNL